MRSGTTSLHSSAPNRTVLRDGVRPEDQNDIISFIDACQAKGLSRKTLITYREAAFALGAYSASKGMPLLADLTREHIEDYFGALRAAAPEAQEFYERRSAGTWCVSP